jgi:hypothetical protein
MISEMMVLITEIFLGGQGNVSGKNTMQGNG